MNFYGLKNDRGIIGERETRTKSDRQDGPLEPIWQEARGNCLTWARLDTVLQAPRTRSLVPLEWGFVQSDCVLHN
jgi:hypothetical protein